MKFEIFKSEENGEFYFRIKSGNGEVVAQSEGYKNAADAEATVQNIKAYSFSAAVERIDL